MVRDLQRLKPRFWEHGSHLRSRWFCERTSDASPSLYFWYRLGLLEPPWQRDTLMLTCTCLITVLLSDNTWIVQLASERCLQPFPQDSGLNTVQPWGVGIFRSLSSHRPRVHPRWAAPDTISKPQKGLPFPAIEGRVSNIKNLGLLNISSCWPPVELERSDRRPSAGPPAELSKQSPWFVDRLSRNRFLESPVFR